MNHKKKFPFVSVIFLAMIVVGCVCANLFIPYDPLYCDLANQNHSPNHQFLFGTDSMGRDVFSMIWYGGRVSLFIGLLATVCSTVIAIIYGGLSGFSNDRFDAIYMRILDMILSVPSILLLLFLQGILKNDSPSSIGISIGVTSWCSMAKVVRSEVRQLRNATYVLYANKLGAGFFYLLRVHFLPNVIPSLLYMMIMNVGSAIASEATLSFLGIGLPIEEVSWGTLLSNANQALLTNEWWLIIVPGIFLTTTILCMVSIAMYYKQEVYTKCSNLPRENRIRKGEK